MQRIFINIYPLLNAMKVHLTLQKNPHCLYYQFSHPAQCIHALHLYVVIIKIISHYDNTMATDQEWFTDANGREMKLIMQSIEFVTLMITGETNCRPMWKWINTDQVSSNYYPWPVNSRMYMQVGQYRLKHIYFILQDTSAVHQTNRQVTRREQLKGWQSGVDGVSS